MVDWRREKITLASKCEFFWSTNSDLFGDVTFLVGPEEETIKSFKILLMVTSPVLESMLGDRWSRDLDEPIKLPHVDPVVFRQFLRLLLTDNITTQSLQDAQLSMKQVLDLFFLSKEYLVQGLKQNLESLIRKNMRFETVLEIYQQICGKDEENLEMKTLNFIVKNAPKVFEQDNFLTMSKHILLKVLSSDDLYGVDEIVLFNAAHRWAEFQASRDENLDDSRETRVRQILRECLSEIRLPLITSRDLTLHVRPTRVLTQEETISLFEYLSLTTEEKRYRCGPILQLSKSLTLRTEARMVPSKTVVLSPQIPDNPGYPCTGSLQYIIIKSSKKVRITGLGFCGPLNGDSKYEVTVSFLNNVSKVETGEEKKLISAKEKTIFHFPLMTPIIMEKDAVYNVYYKLKGAPTGVSASLGTKVENVVQDGTVFSFKFINGRQIMEIQYIKE